MFFNTSFFAYYQNYSLVAKRCKLFNKSLVQIIIVNYEII